MTAHVIYALCAATSILCALLLLRAWHRTRARLLFWSGLCFVGLAATNVMLVLDAVVYVEADLVTPRLWISLGATILAIAAFMWRVSRSPRERVMQPDALAAALGMHGVYHDHALGRKVEWSVHRTPAALVVFAGIGVLAGMFGLGAGWANVPALHVLMGAPLKLSVATSGFVLSVVDTSAAWVYLNRGAVLPVLVAPSIVGVMLGAKIGARLLRVVRASTVRQVVIWILVAAGARALLKGLGIWN